MNRRNFLKTTSIVAAAALMPNISLAAPIDFGRVEFDSGIYNNNNAQTIMIFLYGGPSELGGNLTNIAQIKANSQSSYDNYFRGVTATANGFWQEAGGTIMEEMLANGDMNIFRTCYSKIRDNEGNRSHGRCVSQNQRGVINDEDTAGIFSVIANTLYKNGVINGNTKLPFLTMEGESTFFSAPDFSLPSFLKPTALSSDLSNPYARRDENQWFYYTRDEQRKDGYRDRRAALDRAMDFLGQKTNKAGKIKENFNKRVDLDNFINTMKEAPTPDGVVYPNNSFAEKLETSIKIMANNPDTKIISLGSGGLGGWDDHNEARDYPIRMENLFSSIKAAVEHIKAEGKEGNINIMVWGDFGRGVNLNSALGWDHGNLQNLYMFGGKNYLNHVGVVGETALSQTGSINRMYLEPKAGSYWFEPASVAATLYSIYGITNPQYLTGGHGAIGAGLLS
jgi:hypothetical protein